MYDTPAAEPNIPDGYQAALLNDPVEFQTMMCQYIYTSVVSYMSTSTQATPLPPKGGGHRGGRGGLCGHLKQDTVPGNCNRCVKEGHYVRDCPERNTY